MCKNACDIPLPEQTQPWNVSGDILIVERSVLIVTNRVAAATVALLYNPFDYEVIRSADKCSGGETKFLRNVKIELTFLWKCLTTSLPFFGYTFRKPYLSHCHAIDLAESVAKFVQRS